jgi:RNA polymerase sigma-70 factor (ECF subfamily)
MPPLKPKKQKLSAGPGVYREDTAGMEAPAAGPFQGEATPRTNDARRTPLRGPWTLSRGGAAGVVEPPPQHGDEGRPTGQATAEADTTAIGAANSPPPTVRVRPPAGGSGDDDRGLTFDQIHRKYNDKIYNLILRWIGDANDAEDLTVETFLNAYRAWDRFRGESKVSTWLYQIAHNCCKNRFKQRDRQREREAMSLDDAIETEAGGELGREVADFSYAPERVLLNQEMAEKIREAIDALPSEYRVVLILDQREDMSYEEIARITGLTVPAVKTRLHRARNKIRQRLEPYYRNWSGRDR